MPPTTASRLRRKLEAAEVRGLLLPAASAAIELLVEGDPRAEIVARCIARLAVEARDPRGSPAYLRRCAVAVLGQLGARDASARVEEAWRRP